jgi:3',5'-cyclic AMP phosphodiesterase CpdA
MHAPPDDATSNYPHRNGGDGKTLTFAHLTDPHLTFPEGAPTRELLNKRMLSYLSWRRRRRFIHDPDVLAGLVSDLNEQGADHLAITGDLTQLGLPRECRAARSWLDALAPPERISLVPGNHDRLVAADWDDTVGLWDDYLFPDGAGDGPIRGFPTLRIRGPVAFIGLSSACPTPPFLATGRVGSDQRERFARILDSTGRSGLCRVVLIHHPPAPGVCKWRKRLVDGGAVAQIIARHGAELVLHGHTHRITRHALECLDGQETPIVGLSSASARGQENGRHARYSLWSVSVSPGSFELSHRGRVYDPAEGVFRDDPRWDPLRAA